MHSKGFDVANDKYKIWIDPNKRRLYARFGVGVGVSEQDADDIIRDVRQMVARLGQGPFDIVNDLRGSSGIPPGVIAPMAATQRWLLQRGLRRVVRVVTSEFVADQFHRVSRSLLGYEVEEVTSLLAAERLLDGADLAPAPTYTPPPPEIALADLEGEREQKRLFSVS